MSEKPYSDEATLRKFRSFLARNREDLRIAARLGDGQGGWLIEILREELGVERIPRARHHKKKIPAHLRIAVYERDEYRCCDCGGHRDLSCDHRIPESRGGETTMENLQTLCRKCNSKKGTSMPEGVA